VLPISTRRGLPKLTGRPIPFHSIMLLPILALMVIPPALAQATNSSSPPQSAPTTSADAPAQKQDKSKADQPQEQKAAAADAKPLTPEEERQAQLVADTNRLYELAQELQAEVAKSNKNTLSLAVVKKAAEVEKLARSLKERMKPE
jgi:hypothetical protein